MPSGEEINAVSSLDVLSGVRMQANQNGNRRLDSWKEIAAHLGRNERTAIRWEKKGLPIHRVPGGQRQAVFAYTAEIDAWLNGHDRKTAVLEAARHGAGVPDQTGSEVQPNSTVRPKAISGVDKSPSYYVWKALIAGVVVLAFIVMLRLLVVHSRTSASVPFRFTQLTHDGKYRGNFQTDGTTLYMNETDGARWILVARPVAGGDSHSISTPFANVILRDLSNDGRSLLITSFEGIELDQPLWTIPVEGGVARRLGNVLCAWARWSPDNRRIACASGTSIVILGSDGSDPHPVATFPFVPSNLLWSPDGQRLQFLLRDTAGSISSWRLTFGKEPGQETAILSKLQDGKDACWDWTWTRNGDRLACLKVDLEHRSSLLIEPSDGLVSSQPAREAEFPFKLDSIVGVAPGKLDNSLFVLVAASDRGEFLKVDAEKKTFQTYLQGLSADSVSFSRDHQWMTYVSSGDRCLWRSRVDGAEAVQLTRRPMDVEQSTWSPDDRQIAFMGKMPGRPWRIYLIRPSGGDPSEVSKGDDNQGVPTWSADGRQLIYANVDCSQAQLCWIHRVDLNTGRTELLPGSHGLRTARWSPDGRYITALWPEKQELVLFNVHSGTWTKLADSVNGDNINWSSDSQSVFVDSPHGPRPMIERIRVTDKHRTVVANLASMQNPFGLISNWVGLTPDDSPILLRVFGGTEVYSLEWTDL